MDDQIPKGNPEQVEKDKKLIAALDEWNPEYSNAAVVLHFDKETQELKSISPVILAKDLGEFCSRLADARDAIQQILNTIVDSGLPKN